MCSISSKFVTAVSTWIPTLSCSYPKQIRHLLWKIYFFCDLWIFVFQPYRYSCCKFSSRSKFCLQCSLSLIIWWGVKVKVLELYPKNGHVDYFSAIWFLITQSLYHGNRCINMEFYWKRMFGIFQHWLYQNLFYWNVFIDLFKCFSLAKC